MAGPEREIALLVDYRAELVVERTRSQSRLRWLLHDLDPRLEPAVRAAGQRRRPGSCRAPSWRDATIAQVRIGRDGSARIRELVPQIRELSANSRRWSRRTRRRCWRSRAAALITAARILAEVAEVARFRTDAKLALYAGAAPLDASSGASRHRLNRTGNRQLNSALHMIALTQARIHGPPANTSPAAAQKARPPRSHPRPQAPPHPPHLPPPPGHAAEPPRPHPGTSGVISTG